MSSTLLKIISLFLVTFFSTTVFSQTNKINSPAAMAEKIYLQLDSEIYLAGQTLWFKAIVTSAANHIPSKLSGVLYVELIDPDEHLVEQKIIKIVKGIGEGFFDIDANYSEGRYLLRAYTTWNENFDSPFMFKTYVNIFPASQIAKKDPITDVVLVKQESEHILTAHFNPLLLDSLHKKNLQVYLTVDGKKDSLILKRKKNGDYFLEYEVPEEAQLVTLTMGTSTGIFNSKTIALKEDILDVQFFPESGKLVGGFTNKVGLKILDYRGKGIPVSGEIIDNAGKIITTFKSNKLGMGFFFIQADSTTTYYARMTSLPNSGDFSKNYSLPEVTSKGDLLSVSEIKENIRIVAASNYKKSDSIFIEASCRGMLYYLIKGKLKEGEFAQFFPAAQLPEGIIAFTMRDASDKILAERLYFNHKPNSFLPITISTDKSTYNPREQTKVDIQLDNSIENPDANLSVLVINKKQLGSFQITRENILSYFLLGSELKGNIEDPGYYFRKENENTANDLESLLLTQGWRKYNYQEIDKDTLILEPHESAIQVKGTVKGLMSKKKNKEGINLTMVAYGQSTSIFTQQTDSLGRFNFILPDEYGKEIKALIQSASQRGNNKNYTFTLDRRFIPKIRYDQVNSIAQLDSTMVNLLQDRWNRNDFELTDDVTLLDEVYLQGYAMTPQHEKVTEAYGEPDAVISGKALQKMAGGYTSGLYNVLLSHFPEDINITRVDGIDSYLRADVMGSDATLIVVDGIPVKEYDYHLVPDMPVSEILSVEVIRYAKNFTSLYNQVYPTVFDTLGPPKIPVIGSVIAIYTEGGVGFLGANTAVGMIKTTIPVFSRTREFYTPKYDNLQDKDWETPDLRDVIQWMPQLKPDAKGHAITTFYNADQSGDVLVVIEGITTNGKIGYAEYTYIVEEAADTDK